MNDQPESIEAELLPSAPSAVEAMERANIDVQISTARKYPRSLKMVKQSMLDMATLDVETAESCFYSLPRGKNPDGTQKFITGPSIRLAEIALSCYGNVRAASRIVGANTGEDPHVVIQAVCHDLEKNSAVSVEKRRRITKKKFKERIDEDDINLATNACSAIALRDAVFKIVPGVLVKPVYDAARRVAIGDAKTLSDRRAKAIDTFTKMGVTLDRLLAVLDKKGVDEIGLEDLETLTGIRSAIKDGQLTIESAFPPPQKPETKAGLFGASATTPPAEPAKEAGKSPEPPKEQDAAKAEKKSNLASDKAVLADWMNKQQTSWGQIQPIVAREVGSWAESIGSFEELSDKQVKAVLLARTGLEAELQQMRTTQAPT